LFAALFVSIGKIVVDAKVSNSSFFNERLSLLPLLLSKIHQMTNNFNSNFEIENCQPLMMSLDSILIEKWWRVHHGLAHAQTHHTSTHQKKIMARKKVTCSSVVIVISIKIN